MSEGRYSKLQREPVLERQLPTANPPVRLVRGARVRFARGPRTGLHPHPISTCGVVTKGSFILQAEGEAKQHLVAGDGFFEPACATILRFDNASPSANQRKQCASIWPMQRRPRPSRRLKAAWMHN
jgi:hypothetical protein